MFQGAERKKPAAEPLVPMVDRVAQAQAMVLGFVAEHTLPYAIVPDIIALAQELSRDPKAMASMSMDRTNASYKMRFGLAKSFEEDMCEELRTTSFSLNIDEATSSNLEKVLAVLVSSYSVTSGKVVIRHLTSTSVTRVNTQALYNCLVHLFTKLNLPWTNVVSILMDSCSVMRGSK